MADFVKIPPPERRRRVDYYTDEELWAILVDDGAHFRPLGGPGQRGLQWMTEAITKIAAVRKRDAETVFAELILDIESRTGHKWVAVG